MDLLSESAAPGCFLLAGAIYRAWARTLCRFPLLVLLLFTLARPARAVDATPVPPRRAPSLFATVNYGIVAKIPAGVTYCPMSDSWAGSDHGTEVYLTPPPGCHPSDAYASSSRWALGSVPRIAIYYEKNVAEINLGNYSGPPRTATELMKRDCEQPDHAPVPRGLMLLGRPAVGCCYQQGDQVEIRVMQLYDIYDSDRVRPGQPPDCSLDVTLWTNRRRLNQDLKVFEALTSQISVCTPLGEKAAKGRKACPRNHWW